jgi:thiol-disulfide isomerase/thioredoxin
VNTPVPPRGPKKNNKGRRSGQKQGQDAPVKGKAPARGRQAAYQRQKQQKRLAIGGVALVVVVIAVLVVVAVTRSSSGGSDATPLASAQVLTKIEGITPAALASQATADTLEGYPTAISGAALTSAGKPEIVYVGAEYCPYCAGERWAMIMALSKFGTFTGIKQITSNSTDDPSSIPTFSFLGSTYTSPYVAFDTTETQTVTRQPLQKLSKANNALLTAYDDNPQTAGSIPFIDFANKYSSVGASYDVTPLQHQTHATVADWVADASKYKVGADIQATAGMIVSHICSITGGKPGDVCRFFPKVIGS